MAMFRKNDSGKRFGVRFKDINSLSLIHCNIYMYIYIPVYIRLHHFKTVDIHKPSWHMFCDMGYVNVNVEATEH